MAHHVATPGVAWYIDFARVVIGLESFGRSILVLLIHQFVIGAAIRIMFCQRAIVPPLSLQESQIGIYRGMVTLL